MFKNINLLVLILISFNLCAEQSSKYSLDQFIYTSKFNNSYGGDVIIPGFGVTAINGTYQFNNNILLTGQFSYFIYEQTLISDFLISGFKIDYLNLNWNIINKDYHIHSLKLGKIRIPYGLYNESRTTPFVRPSVFLPQSVYPEKLQSFSHAASGCIYSYNYNNLFDIITLKFEFGIGYPEATDELKLEFFPLYGSTNKIESDLSRIYTLSLDTIDLKYRFKISHVDVGINSTNFDTNLIFKSTIFSLQYNDLKSSTTIELNPEKAVVKNGFGGKSFGWYIQYERFINDQFTTLVRYEELNVTPDVSFIDKSKYSAWAFNLKYYPINNLELQLYYQFSSGTNPLIRVNPNNGIPLDINKSWNIYGLALSYRF